MLALNHRMMMIHTMSSKEIFTSIDHIAKTVKRLKLSKIGFLDYLRVLTVIFLVVGEVKGRRNFPFFACFFGCEDTLKDLFLFHY